MIGPHKDGIHLPFCWSVKKVGNVLTFRELPFLRFSSSFYFQFFNFNFTKLEPPFFRIFLFLSKTFLFRIFLLIYSFMFGNNSSLKLKNWNRRALIRVDRTGKMKIVFFQSNHLIYAENFHSETWISFFKIKIKQERKNSYTLICNLIHFS